MPAPKVTQPYRVVSTNGVAQIQCAIHPQSLRYPYPEEVRVAVLKGLHGQQELCFSILNFTDPRETRMEQKEQVTLSGLNVTDTDMYRCEIQIVYPPPFLRLIGNGTLIHVLGEATARPCLSTKLKSLVLRFLSVILFIFYTAEHPLFLARSMSLSISHMGLRSLTQHHHNSTNPTKDSLLYKPLNTAAAMC
uniref:Immunoglobulin V-set domain-containing protein n=1 Tax=Neolamprologus brichardi TaxID=32507 RepID=A0A3Q4M2L8_NEOBR